MAAAVMAGLPALAGLSLTDRLQRRVYCEIRLIDRVEDVLGATPCVGEGRRIGCDDYIAKCVDVEALPDCQYKSGRRLVALVIGVQPEQREQPSRIPGPEE